MTAAPWTRPAEARLSALRSIVARAAAVGPRAGGSGRLPLLLAGSHRAGGLVGADAAGLHRRPTPPNTRLAGLRTIDIGKEFGPEHIAIGPDGKLYAAMESGNLLRMDPDGGQREVFANTGGRVLGFDFDAGGRLIAADADEGPLGHRSRRPRDLAGRSGERRRSDPLCQLHRRGAGWHDLLHRRLDAIRAREWGGTYQASVLDILEQSASGRVLAYDPATGSTRVVARGFSFANGIALSADRQALFVTETGRYRIWKIDGARARSRRATRLAAGEGVAR